MARSADRPIPSTEHFPKHFRLFQLALSPMPSVQRTAPTVTGVLNPGSCVTSPVVSTIIRCVEIGAMPSDQFASELNRGLGAPGRAGVPAGQAPVCALSGDVRGVRTTSDYPI